MLNFEPDVTSEEQAQEAKRTRKEFRVNVWFDRDLSWLEFNQRVLDEGRDTNVPLLERLRSNAGLTFEVIG